MNSKLMKDRIKEPSTWASIAVALVALGFFTPEQADSVLGVLAALAAGAGAFMSEGQSAAEQPPKLPAGYAYLNGSVYLRADDMTRNKNGAWTPIPEEWIGTVRPQSDVIRKAENATQ